MTKTIWQGHQKCRDGERFSTLKNTATRGQHEYWGSRVLRKWRSKEWLQSFWLGWLCKWDAPTAVERTREETCLKWKIWVQLWTNIVNLRYLWVIHAGSVEDMHRSKRNFLGGKMRFSIQLACQVSGNVGFICKWVCGECHDSLIISPWTKSHFVKQAIFSWYFSIHSTICLSIFKDLYKRHGYPPPIWYLYFF